MKAPQTTAEIITAIVGIITALFLVLFILIEPVFTAISRPLAYLLGFATAALLAPLAVAMLAGAALLWDRFRGRWTPLLLAFVMLAYVLLCVACLSVVRRPHEFARGIEHFRAHNVD